MQELSDSQVQVHLCTFQAFFQKAQVNIRFPSVFFIDWKSINGKNSVAMIGRKRAQKSIVIFDQSISITTEMLYHKSTQKYLKKEGLLHMNLISNSRPDQVKLVGRILIDLSEAANKTNYQDIMTNKLMYCSVEADLSFRMKLVKAVIIQIQLNQLDKSSFSDLYTFVTGGNKSMKHTSRRKMELMETYSQRRFNDFSKSTLQKPAQEQKEPASVKSNQFILIQEKPQQKPQQHTPGSQKVITVSSQQAKINNLPADSRQKAESQKGLRLAEPIETKQTNVNGEAESLTLVIKEQRDALQKELNGHRIHIKQLETNIQEIMKQISQAEEKSSLNQSRLVQSEAIIAAFKQTQNKIKDQHKAELEKITKDKDQYILRLKRQYQTQISQIQVSLQEKTKLLKETQNKIQQLNPDMIVIINQRDYLLQENQKMKNKIAQLQKNTNTVEPLKIGVQIEKLNAELAMKNQALNHLSAELQSKIQSLMDSNRKVKDLELKLSIGNEPIIMQIPVQIKITQSLSKKQQKPKNEQGLIDEFDRLACENRRLQIDNLQLKQKLERAKKEVENLSNVPQLQSQHKQSQLRNELFLLKQKCQLQELQIEQLKTQNSTIRGKIDSLINEKEEIKSSRDQEQAKLRKMLDEKLQNQQLSILKEELYAVKQQLQIQREQIQKSKKINSQLKQKLEELTQELYRLTSSDSAKQVVKQQKQGPKENIQQTIQNKQVEAVKQQVQGFKYNTQQKNQKKEVQAQKIQSALQPQTQLISQQIQKKNQQLKEAQKSQQKIQKVNQVEEKKEQPNILQKPQKHQFKFDQQNGMTNQEIYQMKEKTGPTEQEHQAITDQNVRLRQEIQQNNRKNQVKQLQLTSLIEKLNLQIKQLMKNKQQSAAVFQQQIKNLNNQIQQVRSATSLAEMQVVPKEQVKVQEIDKLRQQLGKSRQIIQELQVQVNKNTKAIASSDQSAYVKELEQRVIGLQQDLKIKDDMMLQSQRQLQSDYNLKYQLAELKQKDGQLQIALKQRDQIINQMQANRQELLIQIQNLNNKNTELNKIISENEHKQVKEQHIDDSKQISSENQQLKTQIQSLKQQLVNINNFNTQLRSAYQDSNNLKIANQKTIQQLKQNIASLEQQVSFHLQQSINRDRALKPVHQLNKNEEKITNHVTEKPVNEEKLVQIQSLKDQLQKTKKELSFENEQKFLLFNELEQKQTKNEQLNRVIVELQQQYQKIKKIMAFQLNSPSRGSHIHIRNTASQYNPSIVAAPMVAGQPSLDGESPTKLKGQLGFESKDRLQTQVGTQTDLQMLRSQIRLLKENIQKQINISKELKQANNISDKKYQNLCLQHQICLQEIAQLKIQCENQIKQKHILQDQLYSEQQKNSNLKDELTLLQNNHQNLFKSQQQNQQNDKNINRQNDFGAKPDIERLPAEQLPVQQQQKLLKDGYDKAAFPPLQVLQENKIQANLDAKLDIEKLPTEQIPSQQQQKPIKDETSKHSLNSVQVLQQDPVKQTKKQVQIVEDKQHPNKITVLEENIRNLQKLLQQQIEINQSNITISQRISTLNEMEELAGQLRGQLQYLRNENQDLKKHKDNLQGFSQQNQELIKINQQYAKQRAEWQQKLLAIQNLLSLNTSRYANQKQEMEKQVQTLIGQKSNLQAQRQIIVKKSQQRTGMQSSRQFEELKEKYQVLLQQLQQAKDQRLNELQKSAKLQEEVNQLIQKQSNKELQLTEIVTIKEQQLEEAKFNIHQLNDQVQEFKTLILQRFNGQQPAKSEKSDNYKQKYEALCNQYHSITCQKEQSEQKLAFNEKQISALKGQLQLQSQQKQLNGQLEDLSSELQKLQTQLAQKVEQLTVFEDSLVQAEEDLQKTKNELEQKRKLYEESQEKNKKIILQLQKAQQLIRDSKNKQGAETNKKNMLTDTLKKQIQEKQKQNASLSEKIKQKDNQIIQLTKEIQKYKDQDQQKEKTIKQLAEKEKQMKETLNLIQAESKKLIQSLKERVQNEQMYYKKYVQKERECNRLTANFAELKEEYIQKQIRNSVNQDEMSNLKIQLQGRQQSANQQNAQENNTGTVDYNNLIKFNQQLRSKNQELLELLNARSNVSIQNQKLKAEISDLNHNITQLSTLIENMRSQMEFNNNQHTSRLQLLTKQKANLLQEIAAISKKAQQDQKAARQSNNRTFEKLLAQKNNEIQEQAQVIVSLKDKINSKLESGGEAEPTESVSILNEQIMDLNNDILEKEHQIRKLKQQLNKKVQQKVASVPQVPSLQAPAQISNKNDKLTVNYTDLQNLCGQIKKACNNRRQLQESKGLFSAFVHKYEQVQQKFSSLTNEAGCIQEKARMISKQMQKVKAFVIKSQSKGMKQKTDLLALLKPCEKMATELVNLSETLSDQQSEAQNIF